jgi:hypothetical protein
MCVAAERFDAGNAEARDAVSPLHEKERLLSRGVLE